MVQCVNKQTVVLLLHPRTEYKKLAHFQNGVSVLGRILERGINFRGIFFRTGCQSGGPGGTYPPKKYPSAPPGAYQSRLRHKVQRFFHPGGYSLIQAIQVCSAPKGTVCFFQPFWSEYPRYQRFFSRAAGSFGVGRRPTRLRPETGNRARRVSGTQGMV